MSSIDPVKISISASYAIDAFNHARQSVYISGIMLPQLYQDIDAVKSVLNKAQTYGLTEETRADIIDLMNRESFKTVNDRVNHLTSPELYPRLRLSFPDVAEAYMKLKTAIGQLDQAVKPPQGMFEGISALSNSPVVG